MYQLKYFINVCLHFLLFLKIVIFLKATESIKRNNSEELKKETKKNKSSSEVFTKIFFIGVDKKNQNNKRVAILQQYISSLSDESKIYKEDIKSVKCEFIGKFEDIAYNSPYEINLDSNILKIRRMFRYCIENPKKKIISEGKLISESNHWCGYKEIEFEISQSVLFLKQMKNQNDCKLSSGSSEPLSIESSQNSILRKRKNTEAEAEAGIPLINPKNTISNLNIDDVNNQSNSMNLCRVGNRNNKDEKHSQIYNFYPLHSLGPVEHNFCESCTIAKSDSDFSESSSASFDEKVNDEDNRLYNQQYDYSSEYDHLFFIYNELMKQNNSKSDLKNLIRYYFLLFPCPECNISHVFVSENPCVDFNCENFTQLLIHIYPKHIEKQSITLEIKFCCLKCSGCHTAKLLVVSDIIKNLTVGEKKQCTC